VNPINLHFGNITARLDQARAYVGRYVKAHHIRRGGFVAAAIGAAVVFFAIGAFIRLLVGPVSLGMFSDRLSLALADALPGLTVRYDQAALEWSRDDARVNLVVLGARVFDPEGRIVAQAPKAELALAAWPLILRGDVELRRIALVGVQLTLIRTRDGELRLGVEKGHGNSDILKRITDAINANNSAQSSLQTFAVRKARLAFMDEGSGLFVVAPRADLQVATAGDDLDASLDADIELSGHAARVKLDARLPSGKKPVSGTLSFTGLSLDALGTDAKAFQTLKGLKMTTDMAASFTLTSDNRIRTADFEVGASGSIAVRGLIHGPLHIENVRAAGSYDSGSGRVLIRNMQLSSDGAMAEGKGQIDIGRDPFGTINRVGFNLSADKISVNMPGLFLEPFKLNLIALRGTYLPAPDEIDVTHLGISGGPFALTASGKVVRAGDASPAIEAQASIAPLGVRDLLRYWPRDVASGAWEWANENMKTGRVGPLVGKAHFSAGQLDAPQLPEDTVDVSMPLSGVTTTYFHKLTPATNVSGIIRLTGDTFSAELASGRIGTIAVSKGKVVITDLHADTNIAEIYAHADGRLSDILTLIDMDPLNYAKRFHLHPKDTLGTAGLDIEFHVPTRHDATDDDIKIAIKSSLKGLDIALGEHTRITDGTVDLNIDNDRLVASGMVSLYGSRLNANWTELFRAPKSGLTSHIVVKGTLDDAARDGLNFHAGQFLKGPANISAVLEGQAGQIRKADMTMDITPATVSVDYLGLGKPAGVPGTALVSATFGPNTNIQSETMKITGNGIVATGGASFDKDGKLTQVSFPSVHAGAVNDFSFMMNRGPSNGTEIIIRGHSLDGSKIGRRGASDVTGTTQPAQVAEDDNEPFHISARLDRLAMRNNVVVSPFALDVSGIGDRPQTLSMQGTFGKAAALTGSITSGEGGRRLSLNADDAGLLLNGLFGFTSMKGGKLDITGTLAGRGDQPKKTGSVAVDFQGTATVTNFRVVNQPFLSRLFAAGSLTGIGNLMSGQGIEFDKLTLPFASRNGVISMKDVRASGGAMGMTADGYLDRPKNQIALKGSLVPIFGLNNILGSIPLLGNLLVGKKGEGVFGMTYSATGAPDEPNISVNPLSLLTPGIFRRIFEGRVPEDAQISQLPQTSAAPPASTTPTVPPKSKAN
jgi:hypothetical protein